jgi:MFS family permease
MNQITRPGSVIQPSTGRAAAIGLLRQNRAYRQVFIAQLVSRTGDAFAIVAVPFAVLDVTGSVAALGYVLAARTVAAVAFILLGGVLADKVRSRTRLLVNCHLARFAAQAVSGALLVAGVARVWEIAVLMFGYGLADSVASPTWAGLLPKMVSASDLQCANALSSFTMSSTFVIGPALSGCLIALTGPGWPIIFDSLSFAVSAGFLAIVVDVQARSNAAGGATILVKLMEGWSTIRSRTWLWSSIAAFSIFQFALIGPIYVLGPYVAQRFLGGASVWGVFLALGGIGSVGGDLWALWLRPSRLLVMTFVSILLCVPSMLLLAVTRNQIAIGGAMVLLGGGLAFGDTAWYTSLQQHVPSHVLSRVSSYDLLGSMLFLPAGQIVAGPLVGTIGIQLTLLLFAMIVGSIGFAMIALPSVRKLRAIA